MTGNWSDYTRKTSGTTDLDQDRTHNKVNEITDITETVGTAWATPAHDHNGNTTTVPKPAALDSGLTLKFDGWNRLAEVQDGATVIGRYEYDGLNRRIKRHLDSQAPGSPDGVDAYIHYFFNQDWQLLETRDTTTESDQPESLQPKYQYLWSPRYIDAPILRDENTDTDGLCDDGRIYYLGDANFNVTALVDTAGDALERYLYEPYGVVTIHDGTWSTLSTSGEDNLVMFAGRERDTESQFYQIRARVYQPLIGRWLSRDPFGILKRYSYVSNETLANNSPNGLVLTEGFNRYAFVRGMPLGQVDPSGLTSIPLFPIYPIPGPMPPLQVEGDPCGRCPCNHPNPNIMEDAPLCHANPLTNSIGREFKTACIAPHCTNYSKCKRCDLPCESVQTWKCGFHWTRLSLVREARWFRIQLKDSCGFREIRIHSPLPLPAPRFPDPPNPPPPRPIGPSDVDST